LAGSPVYEEDWQTARRRGTRHAGREAHYDLRGTLKTLLLDPWAAVFAAARWGFAVIGAWFLLGTLIFRTPAD